MALKVLSKTPLPNQMMDVRIVQNKPLANQQWGLWVKPEDGELPDFRLGTFCMLSLTDWIDPVVPRPFAIAERKDGAYFFIYRLAGKFTKALAKMPVGSKIGLLGPLGKGFEREHFKKGRHIFIAGGVGYASLLPLMETSYSAKIPMEIFYGVREDLEVIRRGSASCHYASDNGSLGFHGRLPELMAKKENLWKDADWFYVCGPTGMMKAIYDILPPQKSFYFLEEAMGCGIGICVGCVIPVLGENGTKKHVRSCMEGPIFIGSDLTLWRKGE